MSHKNNLVARNLADLAMRKEQLGAPCLAGFARRGKLLFFPVALLAGITPLFLLAEPTATLNEGLPAGGMQQKATTACLECHEARIILQQRLSKATWTKEVDKMTKWGAVVDAADRDALIDYLSDNFSPDKPPYIPPRTSKAKSAIKHGN
jgi:hypothetical protein